MQFLARAPSGSIVQVYGLGCVDKLHVSVCTSVFNSN